MRAWHLVLSVGVELGSVGQGCWRPAVLHRISSSRELPRDPLHFEIRIDLEVKMFPLLPEPGARFHFTCPRTVLSCLHGFSMHEFSGMQPPYKLKGSIVFWRAGVLLRVVHGSQATGGT